MQEGGCWFKTGSYWCRKVFAGAGLVVAAAGKWSPMQEGGCWCREVVASAGLVVAGAVSEGIRLGFQN